MALLDMFSEREKDVMDLLLQGMSNKQIAHSLGVSTRTVEFHLSNIYLKLGVKSRSEAILIFTQNNFRPGQQMEGAGLRETTVAGQPDAVDNGEKSNLPRRSAMQKKFFIFIAASLLTGMLIFPFISSNLWGKDSTPFEMVPVPETETVPPSSSDSPPLTEAEPEQASPGDDPYVFARTVASTEVRLYVTWYYIDASRMHLDLAVCNYLIAEDIHPIRLIDPEKISLYQTDGSPIALSRQVNFGGGGGGGEPPAETTLCSNESFDYSLPEGASVTSPQATYLLDIPVGGTILTESGENKTIPAATFHLDVEPTYSGPLTFTTQQTALIEDKTVTFKGLELNPGSAAVFLCVLDPQGAQWLPAVNLLYQGNIISSHSGGLVEDSGQDPNEGMCYRLDYTYPFRFEAGDEPQKDVAVLVTNLTKDQPERLFYELIAHAQNLLAVEGIDFNYVIVNHGSDIVITKKPESLTERQALARVQEALTEKAVSSDVVVFYPE